MTLYESLIKNVGLGKDNVNKAFLDKMLHADYGEYKAIDILKALELPEPTEKEMRKAIMDQVNKWDVKDIFNGPGMRIKDFQIDEWKNFDNKSHCNLATILWKENDEQTDNGSAAIIYIDKDCLRVLSTLAINKQIEKLFTKSKPFSFDCSTVGRKHMMNYIQYDWKDCKTVLH